MYASLGPDPQCPIVRTLDIVGEKWSLLIVRDAHRGKTRYSEFRDSLGAPTDVLSARLASLVEHGILEKRPYREAGSRERVSYHLTVAGEALQLVLAAMAQWSGEFAPATREPLFRVAGADGSPRSLAYVTAEGVVVDDADLITA
jgi:DNA-binding HxlR family transcriptional regulator